MTFRSLFSFLLVASLFILNACGGDSASEGDGQTGEIGSTTDPDAKADGSSATIDNSGKASHYELYNLWLYQPNEELAANLADQDAFVEYTTRFNEQVQKGIDLLPASGPCMGNIIVAINAQGEVKTWYMFTEGCPAGDIDQAVQNAVDAQRAPQVKQSVVAFALSVNLWGAQGGPAEFNQPPFPQEWMEVAQSSGTQMSIAQLMEAAW